MSDGSSYKQILHTSDKFHSVTEKHGPKHKALHNILTGKSQKQQMRFIRQNREYQKKIGRAYND